MFFVHLFNLIRCWILVSKIEKYVSYYGGFKFWGFKEFLIDKKIHVDIYSYSFYRKNGVYVYSRVNGRIYYFEK